jgi:hypothetical protein
MTATNTLSKDEDKHFDFNDNSQLIDIDSHNVLAILFDLLDELKSKTFVTKTKKDCGYHVYWLSHKQHAAIGTLYITTQHT